MYNQESYEVVKPNRQVNDAVTQIFNHKTERWNTTSSNLVDEERKVNAIKIFAFIFNTE